MANEKTIRTRIQNRHAPESYWVSNNTFVPRAGEIIIYDVDATHSHPRVKIGDGQTTIVNLPFSDATVLGETADTAYRGDRGKTAYDHAFAKGSAYSSGLYKVTTNEQGHVTNATPVVKKDITDLGVPAQDTTYDDATQTTHGLMSANDKKKLDNAKEVQTAVSDPTASGTGVEFISGISQDQQGVISPSKKTVRTMGAASANAAGSTGLVPAPAKGDQGKFLNGAGQWSVPTNTKNTAGSTDSSSKLFLIGATSQAASPQTYSHDTAYVGTDGCLYSGGKKVLTDHQDISGKVPTSRKINNKALSADITLDADDIAQSAITETGVDSVDDALGSLSQQIDDLQAAAAYVEDGDTASQTYTEGQFVLWKGSLYTVKAGGLPQGETISGTYLESVTGGGLNSVNNGLNAVNNELIALNNKFIQTIKDAKTGVYVGSYGGPAVAIRLYTDANNNCTFLFFENGRLSRRTYKNGTDSGWETIHAEWNS